MRYGCFWLFGRSLEIWFCVVGVINVECAVEINVTGNRRQKVDSKKVIIIYSLSLGFDRAVRPLFQIPNWHWQTPFDL